MSTLIAVGSPVIDDEARRVACRVGDDELWFVSDGIALTPSPEAIASATLLAAAFRDRQLVLADVVDRRWRRGVVRLQRVFARWWQAPILSPIVPGTIGRSPARDGTALLFTGGVDSFHTLLTRTERPDLLVFVHGYDVALADRRRADDAAALVRDVAAATGTQAVVVRTNLRELRLLREQATWEEMHGGAMAAIGHLLSGRVSRLVVSSSFSRQYHVPWGSHFYLDHLWSSGALRVEHYGAHANRAQKIAAIADSALVHAHLRVCWEYRTPERNCSACPKCAVTMAALSQVGRLAAVRTLRPARPLPELLAQDGIERFWRSLQEIVALDASSVVGRAVAAQLRSIRAPRTATLARRIVDDLWLRWNARPS